MKSTQQRVLGKAPTSRKQLFCFARPERLCFGRAAAVEKAEAQKVTVVKAAEAEAEAKFLSGQGIARQRQAIVAGLRESVVEFSHEVPDITNEEIMNMMLMTQYFDALKDIGLHSNNGTIFLPHQPGTMTDISSQIRNGVLQAQSMNR